MVELTTLVLETPLKRGDDEIAELKFRRPTSGDLRGISIAKLGQLDYDEIRRLLPRIAVTPIIAEEVDKIDTADMIEIGNLLTDFLFTKKRQAEFQTT